MRGQLTVFIIIGILVVVSFTIAFVSFSSVRDERRPVESVSVRSVREYVSSCLELSSFDVLSLASHQGGFLFASQGGEFVRNSFLSIENFSVPFVVSSPVDNVISSSGDVLFFRDVPKYPFVSFPYAGELLFDGYFGGNELPALFNSSSPSVQSSVQYVIAKRVVECSDFSTFESQGLTVSSLSNPVASLVFASSVDEFESEQFVSVELNWPLEVASASGVSELDDFAVRLPVRFSSLYYFVRQLVDSDVSNVEFVPQSVGSFVVSVFPQGEHSLVVVKDAGSIVNNEPFEFWFARNNRAPALWFIDSSDVPAVHAKDGGETKISIERIDDVSATLIIDDSCSGVVTRLPLRASEPDENPFTFSVSHFDVPRTALNRDFSIRVSVSDGFLSDYQDINLSVVACVER